jgi:AbiV family abortive infection protein
VRAGRAGGQLNATGFRFAGGFKMPDAVTPDYLLKGAVYSLEQCGLLLRDATLLHRSGAHASGVVLAAHAREALGQWKILLALREDVIGGKIFTIREIKNRCGDHAQKQKAGMLSITMRADQNSGVGQLLMSRMTAQAGTEEREKTDEALARIGRRMKREVPTKRHEQREVALYVDPIEPLSMDRWNRPSMEISKALAQNFISDARNDYVIQSDRYTNRGMIEIMEPDLFKALHLDRHSGADIKYVITGWGTWIRTRIDGVRVPQCTECAKISIRVR